MSKANEIRRLAAEGKPTAEIARLLGIRYQHAYNVLKRSKGIAERPAQPASLATNSANSNPVALSAELLRKAGFSHVARWQTTSEGQLAPSSALPKAPGVYAFAIEDTVQYVGVATMGLAKRLKFYCRPGVTQRTSIRLNSLLLDLIAKGVRVDIYVATPEDQVWNGLPVHGPSGLEYSLISKYHLPWNIRGAAKAR